MGGKEFGAAAGIQGSRSRTQGQITIPVVVPQQQSLAVWTRVCRTVATKHGRRSRILLVNCTERAQHWHEDRTKDLH